jgi:hypothetical protein
MQLRAEVAINGHYGTHTYVRNHHCVQVSSFCCIMLALQWELALQLEKLL